MTRSLDPLKTALERIALGLVPDENYGLIESLLADAWDELPRPDEGLDGYKLRGRIENLRWKPPNLTFEIERHGGTALGSSRAEIQTWRVDLGAGAVYLGNDRRYRQLYPRQPAFKTRPIAQELARKIVDRIDDPRLQWSKDGTKVRARTSEILPRASAETTKGRAKRLARDLAAALEPHGWTRTGAFGWWTKR